MSSTRRAPGLRGAPLALLLAVAAVLGSVAPIFAQSEADLAKANNPLADMKAFNIQNYYVPELWEGGEDIANTFWFRAAVPTGPVLWRASLPISQVPDGSTGFGDLQLFAAYTFISRPDLTVGIGPQFVFPTAATGFGPDVWQAGLAGVAFAAPNPTFQFGGLVLWQTDVDGDPDAAEPTPNTSALAIQPFAFFQLGGGTYIRGAPNWIFDLENDNYHIPFGLGIGKVVKSGGTVFNFFIEPQYTIAHQGPGQPAFQLYTAVNMQFGG